MEISDQLEREENEGREARKKVELGSNNHWSRKGSGLLQTHYIL